MTLRSFFASVPMSTMFSFSDDRPSVISHRAHLRYNSPAQINMVLPVPDGTRGPKPAVETNVPERFELFILGDGEKKVSEEIDTRKSIRIWL